MNPNMWAHSAPPTGGRIQLLADHLATVRDLARTFAQPLGMEDEAALAGMLHDYGKYGELFQQRHWS